MKQLRIVTVPSIYAGCPAFDRIVQRWEQQRAELAKLVSIETIEALEKAEELAFLHGKEEI